MLKTYLWLTFCVTVWGSNFVFGKMLLNDFSPAALTSLRLLFIVIFLFIFIFSRHGLQKISLGDWGWIFLLGVVGVFINQWSFFEGLVTADSTTSALIIATAPIMTGILAAVFLKETFTIRMLLGSIIAITGIYFVATEGGKTLQFDRGLLWIVVTMVTFAIMIIITRILSQRIIPIVTTFYSNVIGFIISVPAAIVMDDPVRVSEDWQGWGLLIVTAIVVHGLANLIWNHYIRYAEASKASILSNLEPFVAMAMGVLLLHKPITLPEMAGSLLIVGGVIFANYQHRKRSMSHS
ncbi:DMT family transporter [Oceanobacillus piezotolerans]|uniref:DMT family transporter n=1 Tax=Oceanobacillus piezotolerans TaxID=2448030 RepID=A0A498D3Y2_9BACI|nr:DMT family transporter [Oceanobacillus piezotolerans]RLL42669.1 DMT family transporter [Oceanobacillus piezotolerans]